MEKRYEMRAAVRHVSLKVADKRIKCPAKIGHHFWVLVEINGTGQETIIESIHGLSMHAIVDKDGIQHTDRASIFETWHSTLEACCTTYPLIRKNTQSVWVVADDKDYWMKPDETFAVYHHIADSHDNFAMWNKAKQFITTLNNAKLPYSVLGIGKTLGLKCRNSNSVYAAIAHHLEIKPPLFEGYKAPGLNTSLLPKAIIEPSAASHSGSNNASYQKRVLLHQQTVEDDSGDNFMQSACAF